MTDPNAWEVWKRHPPRPTDPPKEKPAMPEPTLTDRLMTPREVANVFRVDPKTVSRWAKDGLLPAIRTLGGHRRFYASDVAALLDKAREETQAGQAGRAA